MKFIKPYFEILPQGEGLDGVYKQIEIAGRTCYKSTDRISENSAEAFTQRMIDSKHGAMCEHGTVYLKIDKYSNDGEGPLIKQGIINEYKHNEYSYVKETNTAGYITTNYRVLIENKWLDDLKYMVKPTRYHEKRVTVRFHMDRIGTQSCVRHRTMSFGQESTRFVNYSKDRFGKEVNFSIPSWTNEEDINEAYKNKQMILDVYHNFLYDKFNSDENKEDIKFEIYHPLFYWLAVNEFTEWSYMKLIECGMKAEQARVVLPGGIDSEIVITGSIRAWKAFFDLRHFGTTGTPHPDIKALASGLYEEFINKGFIERKETLS